MTKRWEARESGLVVPVGMETEPPPKRESFLVEFFAGKMTKEAPA